MARKVEVEIIGDSRSLERAFKRSEKAATSFTGTIGRSFRGAFSSLSALTPALIGAAGFVAATKYAVDAASDLNEQMNRTTVLFGDSAAGVEDWSKTTTVGFGVARREALAMAGAFGSMFETSGRSQDQAAQMSEIMVQLAGDMASFNNADPTDMLQRLQSALSGEPEPLRKFGVFISDNTVKAEAYRDGIARVGSQLTDQQKVLGRYNVILRQTGTQQGDFTRTSGGLANLTRILRAQLDNLATSIGTMLLPYVQAVTKWLVIWLGNTKNQARLQQWFRNIIIATADAIDYLARTFGPLLAAAGDVAAKIITNWTGVKTFFGTFFLWLQRTGLTAFRKMIEPFSHIPSGKSWVARHILGKGIVNFGQWSRDTKAAINRQLPGIDDAAAKLAEAAVPKPGGKTMEQRVRAWMKGLKMPKGPGGFSQIIKQYQDAIVKGPGGGPVVDPKKAKAAAAKAKRDAEAARQARIDSLLGWAELAVAQAGLTKPLNDDLRAMRHQKSLIQKLIGEGGDTLDLRMKLVDVEKRIQDTMEEQAKNRKKMAKTAKTITSEQVLASFGLNLNPAERRHTLQMIAQYGRGWTLPVGHTPAFAGGGVRGGVNIHGDVHVHGVQDIGKLENQLTKRAKARAHVRRGT
jgi:hypothetical protein